MGPLHRGMRVLRVTAAPGDRLIPAEEDGMEKPMAGAGVDSCGGFLWDSDQAPAFKGRSAPLMV